MGKPREVKFIFRAVNRTQAAFRSMRSALSSVQAQLIAVAGAAFGLASIRNIGQRTQDMNDLADATGITARQVQILFKGLREVGQEGAAEDILGDLAEKLAEVRQGSSVGLEVEKSLRGLGATTEEIRAGFSDTFGFFERLVELAGATTFEKRNFPLKEIFGDEGARAVSLLIGEFGNLDGVVTRFGDTFRTKAQLDKTEEAFDKVGDAVDGVNAEFEKLIANNAEDISKLVDLVAELVAQISELIGKREELSTRLGRGAFETEQAVVGAVEGSTVFGAGARVGFQARQVAEGNKGVIEAIRDLGEKVEAQRVRRH